MVQYQTMPEQPQQQEFTDEELGALADELLNLLADARNPNHAMQIELQFGRNKGLIGNITAVKLFDAAIARKRMEKTSTEMEAFAGTVEMPAKTLLALMSTRILPAATPFPLDEIIPIPPPEKKQPR